MAVGLSLEAVKGAVQERGLVFTERSLSRSVSSLIVGRHLLILATATHLGLALAETIADVAAETGLCYGSLVLGPDATRLLSPANVMANELKDDFWLIARAADPVSVSRVDAYIAEAQPAGTWRAIIAADVGYGEALRGFASYSRRRFAFVDLS